MLQLFLGRCLRHRIELLNLVRMERGTRQCSSPLSRVEVINQLGTLQSELIVARSEDRFLLGFASGRREVVRDFTFSFLSARPAVPRKSLPAAKRHGPPL